MQFPDDIDRDGEGARPAGLEPATVKRSRSRVVMWSLLLHGLAIAALWGVLAGQPQDIEVDEAPVITVDLVALAQSAPRAAGPANAPSTAQPAEPQPATPVSTPVLPPVPPPVPQDVQKPQRPAPRPQAEPTPQAEPRPAPTPAPPQAATPTAASSDTAQASQRPSGGGGGATATQQTANASDVAKASYARLVLTRLQRAIVYPRRALRREIEGVVTVEMVLAANGTLRTVRLLETSGSTILDDAALKLVRRVAPFPAVPKDLSPGGQDIAFKTPIQYQLQ